MKITVVDPDLLSREGLRALLGIKGYLVTAASEIQEGLRLARSGKAKMVLLRLPPPQCLEAVRLLRADREVAKTPILLIADGGPQGPFREAMEAGATDWVSQPYEVRDLTEKIRTILESNPGEIRP